MRASVQGLVLTMLLVPVAGCHNMWNGPPQVITGCVARQDATAACRNMLPVNWKADPKWTAEFIEDEKRLPLTKRPKKADRKSLGQCQGTGANKKKFAMSYDAPVEMKNFPSGGTGTNDLVVAVFTAEKVADCPEARYGVLDVKGNDKPGVVYFVTVRTDNVVPIVTPYDRRIGEWTSWKIYKNAAGAYELEELRQGAYIQCGKRHDTSTFGDVDFTSCKTAHVPPPPSQRIGLLDRYFTIRSANASVLQDSLPISMRNDEIDPAWGRCGALGCCASY